MPIALSNSFSATTLVEQFKDQLDAATEFKESIAEENARAIRAALARAGIAQLRIEYTGSDDDYDLVEIEKFDADGCELLLDANVKVKTALIAPSVEGVGQLSLSALEDEREFEDACIELVTQLLQSRPAVEVGKCISFKGTICVTATGLGEMTHQETIEDTRIFL